MSAAVRFLAVVVAGWVVVRGVTAGMLPGPEMFTAGRADAASATPQIVPTEFPPIEPVAGPAAMPTPYPYPYPAYAYSPPPPVRYAAVPMYYPAPVSAPRQNAPPEDAYARFEPEPQPQFFADIQPIDQWPLTQKGPTSTPDWNGRPTKPGLLARMIPAKHLDRLQMSTWALMRGPPGEGALASGGTLGGSQAGARLSYALNRQIAATVRSSTPIGGSRGGEVAAGLRFTPFPSIPIALTAERRQKFGRFSTGRNDFALFLEGGVYQQPIAWGFNLDGYAQAGVVGIRTRDLFADGGFALTGPLFGRFSAGAGVWGGYQPGIYRIDAGPRLSMELRRNVRLHLDYRQRIAGAAEPRSGPALTLAADF